MRLWKENEYSGNRWSWRRWGLYCSLLIFYPGRLSLLWLLAPGNSLYPTSSRKNISILTIVKAGPGNRSQIQSHWRKLSEKPDENVLDFDDIIDEEQCSPIWALMTDSTNNPKRPFSVSSSLPKIISWELLMNKTSTLCQLCKHFSKLFSMVAILQEVMYP